MRKRFVMQWHYRGHRITEKERRRYNIPDKYTEKLDSLHVDMRCDVGDHLEGFTILSPTSTDPKVEDKLMKGKWKHVRTVLKVPQPKSWLDVEGIMRRGAPGTTPHARAVYVIIAKGEYEPLYVSDHIIRLRLYQDKKHKINRKIFKQADDIGLLITRQPEDRILPEVVEFHIAHIEPKKWIILSDEVKE